MTRPRTSSVFDRRSNCSRTTGAQPAVARRLAGHAQAQDLTPTVGQAAFLAEPAAEHQEEARRPFRGVDAGAGPDMPYRPAHASEDQFRFRTEASVAGQE